MESKDGHSSNGEGQSASARFRPWQRLRGQPAFRRERNSGVYRHSAAALVRILPPWEQELQGRRAAQGATADEVAISAAVGEAATGGAADEAATSGAAGKTATGGAAGEVVSAAAGEAASGAAGVAACGTAGELLPVVPVRSIGRIAPTGRRLGVVASRKVGNAVVRNRAKRQWREIFRLNQQLLPVDCDVLVIVRKGTAEANRAEMEALFADVAQRARRAFAAGKKARRPAG